ncbi:MAG TPA: MATE family efflux transporter [Terriglobales bacterium]|nr:MATE family efflux transporter [Terriglobales bacterium]
MFPSFTEIRAELRPLWRLAWPVILAELGWHSMSLVDTMIVGRVSADALGGVSVGSALYFVFAVFGIGLLLGLDYAIAHAVGRGDEVEASHILRQGLILAAAEGVLLTPVLQRSAGILAWLGVEPQVLAHAEPYLDALSWSLLPLLLFTAARRYLQAVGAVKVVMAIMVSANVINAVAVWALVFGAWGLPVMGARGAGWGTLAARLYMMLGALYFVRRISARRRGARFGGSVDWPLLTRLFRLGFPAALQITLEVGVFALATALAGRLGATPLAAHHIVLSIAGLTFMMPLGLSSASAVRVGHQLGMGERVLATHSGWTAIAIGIALMATSGVVLTLAPGPILSVFTNDEQVIATASSLIFIAALFQIFDGIQVVATGVLRGTGETRIPMISNLFGHWIVGLPTGYGLCFWAGWGVIGLWVGLSTGLIVVAAILLLAWTLRIRTLLSPASIAIR